MESSIIMNKEQQFRTRISEYFHKHDSSLEGALFSLINHQYPDEVAMLQFVIFPDGFTSGFPVRAFFMDKDVCEFFVYRDGEAEYPSPVDPGLLEIPFLYPEALEEECSDDDEFDIWSVASDELVKWFSERWKAAGGNFFKKAAIIMEHDDNRAFSLNSFEWIEDN